MKLPINVVYFRVFTRYRSRVSILGHILLQKHKWCEEVPGRVV